MTAAELVAYALQTAEATVLQESGGAARPGYSLMAATTLEVLQANGFKFVKLEVLRANGFELVNRRSLVEMQDAARRRMLDETISLAESRYYMGRVDALRDVLAAMTELNNPDLLNTRTTP